MSVPWEGGNYRSPPDSDQVNCLHLTSILNTLPCSLVVSRDSCKPAALIRAARGMSVAVKQSGHVTISLYCAVSLWALFHQVVLLPPPVSLPQCLFICLIVNPILASTPFSLNQVILLYYLTLLYITFHSFLLYNISVNILPCNLKSLSLMKKDALKLKYRFHFNLCKK